MNPIFIKALKYIGAFLTGFVGSAINPLLGGHWPTAHDLPVMVAVGLMSTGLFHASSPKDSK